MAAALIYISILVWLKLRNKVFYNTSLKQPCWRVCQVIQSLRSNSGAGSQAAVLSLILLNDVSKTSFIEHSPLDCISANRAVSRIQGAFTGNAKASVIAEARHFTLQFCSVLCSSVQRSFRTPRSFLQTLDPSPINVSVTRRHVVQFSVVSERPGHSYKHSILLP